MPMSVDYWPLRVDRERRFPEEAGDAGFAFYMSRSALDAIESDGPTWKFEDAKLLESAIRDAVSILEGLKRKEYEDGYCYVAKPPCRSNGDGQQERSPKDQVFLVFAKKEFGLVVFEWEWRKVDPKDSDLPVGQNPDFGSLKWRQH